MIIFYNMTVLLYSPNKCGLVDIGDLKQIYIKKNYLYCSKILTSSAYGNSLSNVESMLCLQAATAVLWAYRVWAYLVRPQAPHPWTQEPFQTPLHQVTAPISYTRHFQSGVDNLTILYCGIKATKVIQFNSYSKDYVVFSVNFGFNDHFDKWLFKAIMF